VWDAQLGQGDYPLRSELAAVFEQEVAAPRYARQARGHDLDVSLIQQVRHRAARTRAEDFERLLLGRDELPLDVACAQGLEPGGRQKRQLVQRKRPSDMVMNREGDAADLAGLELLEQAAEGRDVLRPPEGEGARHRLDRLRSDREQPRVVAQDAAADGVQPATAGIDACQRVASMSRAVPAGKSSIRAGSASPNGSATDSGR